MLGYCKLKKEALDRTLWRTGLGRDYGLYIWVIYFRCVLNNSCVIVVLDGIYPYITLDSMDLLQDRLQNERTNEWMNVISPFNSIALLT
jgi:hypothetical protein